MFLRNVGQTTGLDGVKSQKIAAYSLTVTDVESSYEIRCAKAPEAVPNMYTGLQKKVNNLEATRRHLRLKTTPLCTLRREKTALYLLQLSWRESSSQQQRWETRFKHNRHYRAASCWYIQTHAQAGVSAKRGLRMSLFCLTLDWRAVKRAGIATANGLDESWWGQEFSLLHSSRPALGPTQWVPGALSPGVKWQGRKADHSSPASAEVKKMWIYTSTPPIRLHVVVLN
jgi:hypothetical protein